MFTIVVIIIDFAALRSIFKLLTINIYVDIDYGLQLILVK